MTRFPAARALAVLVTLITVGPVLSACDDPVASLSAEEYIARAQEQFDKGHLRAARIELQNALQKQPANPLAHWWLAKIYVDIGDGTAAEKALERAREAGMSADALLPLELDSLLLTNQNERLLNEYDPARYGTAGQRGRVLVARGEALLQLGRVEDARKSFEAALEASNDSAAVEVGLGRVAMARHAVDEAQKHLDRALALSPNNRDALELEGELAYARGDSKQSEAVFESLVKANPEILHLRIGLAQAQIAVSKLDAAVKNLDFLLKHNPNHPRTNFLRALAAFKQKDFALAKERAEKVLQAEFDYPPAVLISGVSAYMRGEYEQAVNRLRHYTELAPAFIEPRQILAAAEMRLGRAKNAVETLAPAVDGNDQASDTLLAMIAEAALRGGDLEGARGYLQRAAAKAPENTTVRESLGAVKVALGDLDQGLEDLKKAAEDDRAGRAQVAVVVNLLRAKRYQEALQEAQALQQAAPGESSGFVLAGLAHHELGDDEAATASFKKALEVKPGDVWAARNLATLAVGRGDFDGAAKWLKSVIEHDPRQFPIYAMLADLEQRKKQTLKAIAWLEQGLAVDPSAHGLRLPLSRLYLTAGESEKALATVEPALNAYPDDPSLLEVSGKASLALDKYADAAAAFSALARARPDSAEAHTLLARAYAGLGDGEAIGRELQAVLKLQPDNDQAKVALARVHLRLGRKEAAEALITKLAKAMPDDPVVAGLEGDLRMAQERPADAVVAYQRAFDKLQTTRAAVDLARARALSGDKAGTVKLLSDWVESHPDDPVSRLVYASFLVRFERFADAAAQYRIVTERLPKNPIAFNELALLELKLGRKDQALAAALKARELAPGNPMILDTYGVALYENKRAGEAVSYLRRAVELAPKNPELSYHLAEALARSGATDDARTVLDGLLAEGQAFTRRADAEALRKRLE